MAVPWRVVFLILAVAVLMLWAIGALAFFMGTVGGEAPPLQFEVPQP